MELTSHVLNTKRLVTLPTYSGGGVSTRCGMGCFMDPPNYPTYFLQSVDCGARMQDVVPNGIITHEGVLYTVIGPRDDFSGPKMKRLFADLWVPLPYEHPRVQKWIADNYAYFAHMYVNPETNSRNCEDLVCWPCKDVFLHIGKTEKYKFISEKYTSEEDKVAFAAYNEALKAKVEAIAADPCNHDAYRAVKEFYPQHEPNLDMIANPPKWGE